MRRAAIIDNTVLVNLIDSGLDDILIKSYTIFSNLFIPETILQEFLNVPEPFLASRQRFADRILFDRGFFRRCNTFDVIVLGELQTERGVDQGEAEAIAQAVRRGISLFLTDDARCRKYVETKRPYLLCRDTPFLIALLDLNQFLLQPNDSWKRLYQRHKFKSSDLRISYQNACNFIGMTPSRKFLSHKSNLKRILEA